jgi:hypothetical protein
MAVSAKKEILTNGGVLFIVLYGGDIQAAWVAYLPMK